MGPFSVQAEPVLVIENFRLLTQESEEQENDQNLKYLGTSLAHVLEIALRPYAKEVRVVPRGKLWETMRSLENFRRSPDNLFHKRVLAAVKADFVFRGTFEELADKFILEGTLVPVFNGEVKSLLASVRPELVDTEFKKLLPKLNEFAKNVVRIVPPDLSHLSGRVETARETVAILAGCVFPRRSTSDQKITDNFTNFLSRLIGNKFETAARDKISYIVKTMNRAGYNCAGHDGNLDLTKEHNVKSILDLARRYNVEAVVSGTYMFADKSNPYLEDQVGKGKELEVSDKALIVMPIVYLLKADRSGLDEFVLPPAVSGQNESLRSFRSKVVVLVSDFADTVFQNERVRKDEIRPSVVAGEAFGHGAHATSDIFLRATKTELSSQRALLFQSYLTKVKPTLENSLQRAEAHFQLASVESGRSSIARSNTHLRLSLDILESLNMGGSDLPLTVAVNHLLAANKISESEIDDALEIYRDLIRSPVFIEILHEQPGEVARAETRRLIRDDPINLAIKISGFFLTYDEIENAEFILQNFDQVPGGDPDGKILETRKSLVQSILRKIDRTIQIDPDGPLETTNDLMAKIDVIQKEFPAADRISDHYWLKGSYYYRKMNRDLDANREWNDLSQLMSAFIVAMKKAMKIENDKDFLIAAQSNVIEILILDGKWDEAEKEIKKNLFYTSKSRTTEMEIGNWVVGRFLNLFLKTITITSWINDYQARNVYDAEKRELKDFLEEGTAPKDFSDFTLIHKYMEKGPEGLGEDDIRRTSIEDLIETITGCRKESCEDSTKR
jgi:hypothetical protein